MKQTKQFIVLALAVLCFATLAHAHSPVTFKAHCRSFVQDGRSVIANSIVCRKDSGNSTQTPYHTQSNRSLLNDRFNMQYSGTENKSAEPKIQPSSLIHRVANEIKSIKIYGFPSGYYIIANVFEKESGLKNFLWDVQPKTLSSALNPKNQCNYVNTTKTNDKHGVVDMCPSNMNKTYNDDVWILSVNKHETVITNLD